MTNSIEMENSIMQFRSISIGILVALTLSGCAGNIKFQESPPATNKQATSYSINKTVKSAPEIFAQAKTITPSTPIYYYQNYGGGGVAVGVLFGPIGVLANMAMINSNTNNDLAKLSGKINLDPIAITQSSIENNNAFIGTQGNAGELLISPYIIIVKGEDDILHFSTTLDVSSGTWKGRYSYHLDSDMPFDKISSGLSPTETDQIKASAEYGFKQALTLLERDIAGTLKPTKEISFYSEPVSPRIKMSVPAKLIEDINNEVVVLGPGGAEHFSYALYAGYHQLQKRDAEITAR